MKIKENNILGSIEIFYAPNESAIAAHTVNKHVRQPNGARGKYYVSNFGLCYYKLKLRLL